MRATMAMMRSSQTIFSNIILHSPSLLSQPSRCAFKSLYFCQMSGWDLEDARWMSVTWNSGWTRRFSCSCRKNLPLFDETEAKAFSRASRISFLGNVTEMYSIGRGFLATGVAASNIDVSYVLISTSHLAGSYLLSLLIRWLATTLSTNLVSNVRLIIAHGTIDSFVEILACWHIFEK